MVENKKGMSSVVLVAIILLVGIGGFLVYKFLGFRRVKNDKTAVFLPTYLPAGYKITGPFQLQMKSGKDIYVVGFKDTGIGYLTFTQQQDNQYKCSEPTSKSLTNYKVFTLANGALGCAVTGFGKDRLFNWIDGENRFTLKSEDLKVNDEEIIKVANSLEIRSEEVIPVNINN